MAHYLVMIIRTVILYFLLLALLRIMGKRELGQLSPFDFVIAIMIAELATIPMENLSVPLLNGIIPIFVLAILEIFISCLALKSPFFRKIIDGTPSIIIKNGQIQVKELKKSRFNLDDLLSYLREKAVFDLKTVEYAILERSGKLSIILKSQKRALTPEDVGVSTDYEGISVSLIFDGVVDQRNLEKINLDEQWLDDQLNKLGFSSAEDVFFASINTRGELYVTPKDPENCEKEL